MSKTEKLIERFFSIPTPNDITIAELRTFASCFGFEIRQGSKHQYLYHLDSRKRIPFPAHGKDIDDVYIRQLVNFIEKYDLPNR